MGTYRDVYKRQPLAMYTGDLITVPVNLAGLCALSMPMGFAGPDKTSLPCGLQVIGKPFDDQLVLRLGPVSYTHLDVYKRQALASSRESTV